MLGLSDNFYSNFINPINPFSLVLKDKVGQKPDR